MKTKEIIKSLAAVALIGSISLGVTAQTVDYENIKVVDTKILTNSVPILLPPPPPPPPPPKPPRLTSDAMQVLGTIPSLTPDVDHGSFKLYDGIEDGDHIPNMYLTPEAVYSDDGIITPKEGDFEFPDHDPGYGGQPIIANVEDNTIRKVDIKVYPNPSTDFVNVDLTGLEGVSLKLIDAAGRLVLDQQVNGNAIHNIDLQNIENGLYILVVETGQMRESRALVVRS